MRKFNEELKTDYNLNKWFETEATEKQKTILTEGKQISTSVFFYDGEFYKLDSRTSAGGRRFSLRRKLVYDEEDLKDLIDRDALYEDAGKAWGEYWRKNN